MNDYSLTNSQTINEDLKSILTQSEPMLREIVNSRIAIFGATGFVGTWLTLSIGLAISVFRGRGKVIAVSRGGNFYQYSHLNINNHLPTIEHVRADVRLLDSKELPKVDYAINAATPARATLNIRNPRLMMDTIVIGQRRILEYCENNKVENYLFLSSGAVYGQRGLQSKPIAEDDQTSPSISSPTNAYHEAKRMAEMDLQISVAQSGLRSVIARLFAFMAPLLPVDEHFAAGNFLGSANRGLPIEVRTSGKSIRSYQYSTDMVHWLLTLLIRGQSGEPYNVGSSKPIAISELANLVSLIANSGDVRLGTQQEIPSFYVPDTSKAETRLGLTNRVTLETSIKRTLETLKELRQINNAEIGERKSNGKHPLL
jgi:UDP-glucuronate decarboxylase